MEVCINRDLQLASTNPSYKHYSERYYIIQWNPSKMDTIGTKGFVCNIARIKLDVS